MSVLEEIILGVREDLIARKTTLQELEDKISEIALANNPIPFLKREGMAVIAEIKRSSPSKGLLANIPNPADLAKTYQAAGAAVVSVLTESRRFGGSMEDLAAVRKAVSIPVLRKDFMVDEYQFYEARAYGADMVLLIVAALSQAQLVEFMALSAELGMRALVEVHTMDELTRALEASPEIIGVNSRNLKTLQVDRTNFSRLIPIIPAELVRIAESGIGTRDDLLFAQECGADAVLVGEALVRGAHPGETLRALLVQE